MPCEVQQICNYLVLISILQFQPMQPSGLPISQTSHIPPLYLYGSTFATTQSSYAHLLYLIGVHPSFMAKVNSFLQLLHENTPEGIIKMGSLIYAFLLPELPKNLQRKLAVELFNSLQVHSDTATYTNLLEFLLKICSDVVDNIDVRSAVGVLDLIESRITDHFVIDAKDPSFKRIIQTNIKLEIFELEHILKEAELPEKFHRKASEFVYFEQKVQFHEDFKVEPWQVVIKKLKERPDEVIPLGYVHEQFCFDYVNSNFEIKNSYRLKGNKNILVGDKVQFWVSLNGYAGNNIRDKVVNDGIYYNCPVIGISHLPENINPPPLKVFNVYKLNEVFNRISYFQMLKELTSSTAATSTSKYFNTLSEFYDRDQFNIDQICLTKEKFAKRRKEQALGIQSKQTIKKEPKDYEDEARVLPQRICKSKFENLVEKRLEDNIRDLTKSLRVTIQEDKNVNAFMQKYLSATQNLPTDNENTFRDDIIELAKRNPLQILIVGRAKSGKTTLARAIAKEYNLIHISIETIVAKLVERANFFKQNPPEADEDGNIKGGLLKIEQCILSDLDNGRSIENEDLLDLINIELKKEVTRTKGFILDLPLQYNDFWYKSIITNVLYFPKLGCRFFNKVIQIDQSQDQWAYFLKGLMIKPEDLTITSALDRYFRSKPKPPPEQGEEEQLEEEEKPAQLVETNLLRMVWDKSVLPLVQHITNQLNPLDYLKIKNSYQNVEQVLSYLDSYLYRTPLAKKIQGNEKELLTVGLEEQKIARRWSPWGLIDPVELHREKLLNGKFQFASEYGGRVFVFQNENNLNLFLESPRKYLQRLPSLPKRTNIAIAGPRKSGKKTLARLLSEAYGLKIIDFEQILKSTINKQRHNESHIPSNPDKTSKTVHLSEIEFKQFSKGGILNAKDILPIVLYNLGITLQKKPQNWGVEKNEQEGNAEEVQEQKKVAPKKPKKKEKNDDERPKTPPLQDLSLKEIIPQVNHKGKLDQIKGFILVGYPHNEEQLAALRSFNIPIDKFILLSDNSEQNPFKTLSKRLTGSQVEQLTNFMAAIGPVKQALGEEVFKEITNLEVAPEQIFNRIRQFIDPFYPKCDEDNINRVCADKQEDGDPIPLGFCGTFCPVTLNSKWLIKGKEQFQTGFQGKRFKFVGEPELNSFKQNPTKYLSKQNLSVPPRIMFIGVRGVGLRTQLLKLNQKYKIPILNYKETLIQQLQNEKNKRKSQRYYNKGFKVPEYNEEGQAIEDPELNEEAADFDRAALETDVVKKIFNGINEIFVNGNYYDVQQEAVQTPFVDLLANARKLPEAVFILRSEEAKWLERNLDKNKVEQELNDIKEKKRQQKRQEREEARRKAQDAGEEFQEPPEENEEEDPQIPKLQDLIAQKQEALKAQREADSSKLDELSEAFKAWNVDVIDIKCEREPKHVSDRINFAIRPYMEERLAKWEQTSMLPIERHRVKDFLSNYIAKESKFGKLNPLNLMRPLLSYPLLYNDRIYYFSDQQERERVMRNARLLQTNRCAPNDINIVPSVCVIGFTKSGKTTLTQSLSKKLGLVKVSLQTIIGQFAVEHKDKRTIDILHKLKKGHLLSDEDAVDLIEKRLSMSDCQRAGWVLDGFPNNRQQCQLLNKRGLLPANVFFIKLSDLEIKKRAIHQNMKSSKLEDYDYSWDIEVLHQRLADNRSKLFEAKNHFITKFNNVTIIDGKITKWGMFQEAKAEIQKKIKNKREFVRSLVTHSAVAASNVGLSFNCILNNLSQFGLFCPISYKIRREYIKLCPKHHRNLAFYSKKIYLLSGEKELHDFIANPEGYKNKGNAFHPPERIFEEQILQVLPKTENKGYCMVDLSRKKLVKGCASFILKYKGKYYATSTAQNMKTFIKNPVLFEMVKLQDKLPVEFEKKNELKKIAKQNDCTAFLEHHLSNILMKSLAQLGYRRPKFPTLNSKESALKFLSISLKANNPNKDDEYRQKYLQKLDRFIKQCSYSQEIREELDRKSVGPWQDHDQDNLLKLCEEYNKFLTEVNSIDKNKYFSQFIR